MENYPEIANAAVRFMKKTDATQGQAYSFLVNLTAAVGRGYLTHRALHPPLR